MTRGVRALQARCRPKHVTAGVAEGETHGTPHLAAFELAFYSVRLTLALLLLLALTPTLTLTLTLALTTWPPSNSPTTRWPAG